MPGQYIETDSPLAARRDPGHALRYVDEALAPGQDIAGEALLAARSGNRELALAQLAALKERDRGFGNVDAARIYAQLGDEDAAFEAFNRAWEVRESRLLGLMADPYLDPLRGDSRYAALVERLGLSA